MNMVNNQGDRTIAWRLRNRRGRGGEVAPRLGETGCSVDLLSRRLGLSRFRQGHRTDKNRSHACRRNMQCQQPQGSPSTDRFGCERRHQELNGSALLKVPDEQSGPEHALAEIVQVEEEISLDRRTFHRCSAARAAQAGGRCASAVQSGLTFSAFDLPVLRS